MTEIVCKTIIYCTKLHTIQNHRTPLVKISHVCFDYLATTSLLIDRSIDNNARKACIIHSKCLQVLHQGNVYIIYSIYIVL